MRRPRTLILDEPVNGLDPEGLLWVRQLVRAPWPPKDEPSPLLAPALAYAAGHQVAVGTAEGFRQLVEGTGVPYLHMGNDMLDLIQSATSHRAGSP